MTRLDNLLSDFTDTIYPCHCVHCSTLLKGNNYLCKRCDQNLPRIGVKVASFCKICCEPFEGKFSSQPTCPNCYDIDFHFDFSRSALCKSSGTIELIAKLKYGKQRHLAPLLGQLCFEAMQNDERFISILSDPKTIIAPIPLHWRRKLWRGFNQATLIADEISKLSQLAMHRMLRRSRYTSTQTRLSRKERRNNLNTAFQLRKKTFKSLACKHLILIDDVFTTGSTSNACAAVIRKECLKVENIVVLTVIRG